MQTNAPLSRVLTVAVLAVAVGLGVVAARRWLQAPPPPPEFRSAAVYAEPRVLPNVELATAGGRQGPATTLLQGRWRLVFFGFTQCPDVCPATLSTVAAALRRMPPDVANQVRPVLITVDPKNDNAQVLANYVAGFDPRIHGLTGEPGLLQKIADSYGAVLGGQKATDHTSLLYLVSPQGEVLRTFLPGAPPQEIAVAAEMAVQPIPARK
jgi:cytochrome oxidase Cu insertion factor (SCO1/SenC/PrrC family)